jgi:hypothetical protein
MGSIFVPRHVFANPPECHILLAKMWHSWGLGSACLLVPYYLLHTYIYTSILCCPNPRMPIFICLIFEDQPLLGASPWARWIEPAIHVHVESTFLSMTNECPFFHKTSETCLLYYYTCCMIRQCYEKKSFLYRVIY